MLRFTLLLVAFSLACIVYLMHNYEKVQAPYLKQPVSTARF